MQTFLPFPDFIHSAKTLNDETLKQQFVDCIAIINNGKYKKYMSGDYPVFKMWAGYEKTLKMYANVIMFECNQRGLENHITFYIIKESSIIYPDWLNDERLHKSHRANLVRIDPEYYGKLWPEIDKNAPFWWPCELKNPKRQKIMEDYWNALR